MTDAKDKSPKPIGKDARGRFVPGNSFSKGRPPGQSQFDRLAALKRAATPKAWDDICEKAVADAKAGDKGAREWLAKYLLPEPKDEPFGEPVVERTGLEAAIAEAVSLAPYEARDEVLAAARVLMAFAAGFEGPTS